MDITLNLIKNFEASSFKFPVNALDKMHAVVVNMLSKILHNSNHINYLDAYD